MKMFWKHVSHQLSAYCHGELSIGESEKVAEHLRVCSRCRDEYEEIKRGVYLAEHLSLMQAPSRLWSEIEALLPEQQIDAAQQPKSPRFALALGWHRIIAINAALFLILGLVAVWYYSSYLYDAGKTATQARVDLDDYLTLVENSAIDASYIAISHGPARFESVDRLKALQAARINRVDEATPVAGYDLRAYRLQTVRGRDVVQLVYGKDGKIFSVFIAPESVKFLFGQRQITDTKIREISCRKVDCPQTSILWFGAGDLHCVLVSNITDPEKIALVIDYFIAAHTSAS